MHAYPCLAEDVLQPVDDRAEGVTQGLLGWVRLTSHGGYTVLSPALCLLVHYVQHSVKAGAALARRLGSLVLCIICLHTARGREGVTCQG